MTEATLTREAAVEVPWSAWHGDGRAALGVPADWRVNVLGMAGALGLSDEAIAAALDVPVGAAPLATLAAGARTAAIAVDDITRPTCSAPILRHLVDRLAAAGLAGPAVTIVIASGAHRRATRRDLELKIGGGLLERVRVVCHDPSDDLVPTDAALGGVPVRLNRAFVGADLRIGVGAVMPHPFAGYSGGGKIVIPGLADLDVLARTHKFALMGLSGGGASLEQNRFRTEMEQAVRRIGLHWTANVVVNADRQTAFLAAGDFVIAHRSAVAAAMRVGATAAPPAPLDALIVNAYPKDGELMQIESALVGLRQGMLDWLAPGAPVILTAACPQGLGEHGLFGPGGRLYRHPAVKTFLGGRKLWIFAADLDQRELRTLFPAEYPAYSSWHALTADLRRQLPARASVGVVPCGPLQLPRSREVSHV